MVGQSLRGELPAEEEEEEEEEMGGGVWTAGRLPSPWTAGSLLSPGQQGQDLFSPSTYCHSTIIQTLQHFPPFHLSHVPVSIFSKGNMLMADTAGWNIKVDYWRGWAICATLIHNHHKNP